MYRRGRGRTPGYRVTWDSAGRWPIAFAAIPEPVPGPGTGEVVGVDRGVAVSAALSTGTLLQRPALRDTQRARLLRLERKAARKAGLNRGILANGWGFLVKRLEDKAPGRVEKINPAYTPRSAVRRAGTSQRSRERTNLGSAA